MKKIVLFIMMFLCSIMPIHANSLASITIELQDSIDDLSKENVDFKLVQVAKLEDGYFVLNDAFCCAEQFGGLGLVAARCFEHVDDDRPFLGLDEG